MRTIIVALVILLVTTNVFAQNDPSLAHVREIFIEKTDNNLDQYLTSIVPQVSGFRPPVLP
jgi:hypothetical protein